MTKDYLKKSRERLVTRSTDIIQNSRHSLSLIENKAIVFLISMMKETDTPQTRYIFNCAEFIRLNNWSPETSYNEIKAMLKKLRDKSWWIDKEDVDALAGWFNICHIHKKSGDIEISFHEDIFPYLIDYRKKHEYFFTYQIQNVMLFKNKYTQRVYELLKSYQINNNVWRFEFNTGTSRDLCIRIADVDEKTGETKKPKSWKNWAIFKRDVLEPVKDEINKYTDIKIEYEGKKETLQHTSVGVIRVIEFYMVSKTNQEKEETNAFIDVEYGVDSMLDEENESSLKMAFFSSHERKLEEETAVEKGETAEDIDHEQGQNIFSSMHPVFFNTFYDKFTQKQIETLYRCATSEKKKNVGLNHVKWEDWETFALHLVLYYCDLAESTPEDTKTTLYKRVHYNVEKDPHHKAETIIESLRK